MKTILRPSGEQYFLKDAIRDFVVVVVGILAALYLESWWQDQQDHAEETLLLAGLREEFVANRAQLTQKIAVWTSLHSASQQAQLLMGKTLAEVDESNVRQTFGETMNMQFFDPRTGQLTSIISSGKLGLVRNTKLRAMIADWPGLVEDLDIERAVALDSVISGYFPLIAEYVSLSAQKPPFEDRFEALLGDRRVYSHLVFTAQNMERSVIEGEVILQATDEIIAMIDGELDGR